MRFTGTMARVYRALPEWRVQPTGFLPFDKTYTETRPCEIDPITRN